MIKPRMLKPGCRIGVLSPSYWLKKEDLEKGNVGQYCWTYNWRTT